MKEAISGIGDVYAIKTGKLYRNYVAEDTSGEILPTLKSITNTLRRAKSVHIPKDPDSFTLIPRESIYWKTKENERKNGRMLGTR